MTNGMLFPLPLPPLPHPSVGFRSLVQTEPLFGCCYISLNYLSHWKLDQSGSLETIRLSLLLIKYKLETDKAWASLYINTQLNVLYLLWQDHDTWEISKSTTINHHHNKIIWPQNGGFFFFISQQQTSVGELSVWFTNSTISFNFDRDDSNINPR